MERDDSPLLHEPDLMLAVLRVAATGQGTVDACIEQLRALRRCARVRDKVPEAEVRARLGDVGAKLERARLIERAGGDQWHLTARGRQVLSEHPDGVDDSVLIQFHEYRRAGEPGSEPYQPPIPPRSPYDLGYEAYGAGRGLADNPHASDVRGSLDWENGWSQARDDDRRRRERARRAAAGR
jgi:restriction system protein